MGLSWQQGPLSSGQSAVFSSLNRCRRDCCTSSRYVGGRRWLGAARWQELHLVSVQTLYESIDPGKRSDDGGVHEIRRESQCFAMEVNLLLYFRQGECLRCCHQAHPD